MARPKKEIKKTQVTFTLEDSALEVIDSYAKKLGRSRSEFVRTLVLLGLDDAKLMNVLGVFKLIEWSRKEIDLVVPLGLVK